MAGDPSYEDEETIPICRSWRADWWSPDTQANCCFHSIQSLLANLVVRSESIPERVSTWRSVLRRSRIREAQETPSPYTIDCTPSYISRVDKNDSEKAVSCPRGFASWRNRCSNNNTQLFWHTAWWSRRCWEKKEKCEREDRISRSWRPAQLLLFLDVIPRFIPDWSRKTEKTFWVSTCGSGVWRSTVVPERGIHTSSVWIAKVRHPVEMSRLVVFRYDILSECLRS